MPRWLHTDFTKRILLVTISETGRANHRRALQPACHLPRLLWCLVWVVQINYVSRVAWHGSKLVCQLQGLTWGPSTNSKNLLYHSNTELRNRVLRRIYGVKYSWNGRADRYRHQQQIKMRWANSSDLYHKIWIVTSPPHEGEPAGTTQ